MLAEPAPWTRSALVALLLAALLAATAAAALLGSVWSDPAHRLSEGLFHGGQVWCFEHMARVLRGEASLVTDRIGWPADAVQLRFVGWWPALAVAPLQGPTTPVGAYNAALLLSFGTSALLATLLLLRLGASPLAAAAAGLLFALDPHALGSLANGQVEQLQHGLLALFLLAVVEALRRAWLLPLVPVAAAALAFSSPSFALFAPLVGGAALLAAWRRPARTVLVGGTALALALLVLVEIARSYDFVPRPGELYAFAPSTLHEGKAAATLVAARLPEQWLAPLPRTEPTWHLAYLGLPLLVGLLALRSRSLPGWCLFLGGAALALGPRVEAGGHDFAGPAALLEAVGYPLARSGMYYRLTAVAWLGAAVLVGTNRRRRPGLAAATVALLALADGLRVTADAWPLPSREVPGLAALDRMRADPAPGAVLVLPLQASDGTAGDQVLLSSFHGRRSSGLLRNPHNLPNTRRIDALLAEATAASEPAGVFREAGLRYVIWWNADPGRPPVPPLDAVAALLGPPHRDGPLAWWRVE